MQPFNPQIAADILSEIKKAHKILMHCHPNPDGDSLGSTLAMQHSLKTIGKEATVIIGDSHKPAYLSMLPGFDTIVIKNVLEVDLKEYDLFLILDSAAPGQVTRLGELVFPESLQTIIIDHHTSNPGFAKINLVDPSYAATTHMIYDLLKMWNIEVTHEAALCLFTGIYTDTASFKYNLSKNLLNTAAHLIDIAPECTKIIHTIHHSNTKENIRFQAIMLNSVKTFFNDSVAITSITNEEMKASNITGDTIHASGVADFLKSVVGWNIGVTLTELNPGKVRVNFRSKDKNVIDVAKVALAMGGGGHPEAAGVSFSGSVAEAQEKVLQAIAETHPQLGPK
ncbi:MAG: bifunctional oligoribonuclease/PAP phosphatase NrnA [bacterium]|nr:bifunctional oligoribonuclease/PAP phosphatase NrnA [bacterium]